jgi:hypothetical protein
MPDHDNENAGKSDQEQFYYVINTMLIVIYRSGKLFLNTTFSGFTFRHWLGLQSSGSCPYINVCVCFNFSFSLFCQLCYWHKNYCSLLHIILFCSYSGVYSSSLWGHRNTMKKKKKKKKILLLSPVLRA